MKTLLFASLLGWASLTSANADFINLDSNVKIVYTEVEIAPGFFVDKATVTTSVTDAVTGVITVKRQTEMKVPSPFGGFTKYETQETTVATPTVTGGTTTYNVQTSSVTISTLVSDNGTPGDAVTTTPVLSDTDVDSGDLDLPAATTFQTIDEDLEVVISPA
jgi:hypothetical protein